MRLLLHHDEYKAIVVPCHHYGMFKSLFPGVSFRVVGVGVGVGVFGWCVKSILSASNKQLVTLKFDTSAICFLLSGETIFFLKFKAVSNIPSFLSIFFESQGGQWTAKGALRSLQIGLLNKRTATTTRVLLIPWQYFGTTKCYQQQKESRNCCKTVWLLPFYDYNTINVKGIEVIFTDIAIWIIMWIKYKMKSHKREICCIVRKISRGCKKCRKILVLQGNPMERFKDAQSTSSVPRMIRVSFLLTFSTHCQVMKVNAS